MVKIEDTHQEVFQEETFQEEVSQEGMAAPINDETAQRIFKAMEEQSDVLKKMESPHQIRRSQAQKGHTSEDS